MGMLDSRPARGGTMALVAVLITGTAVPTAAQERERDRERAPSVTMGGRALVFGSSRGRLGVSISPRQDDREHAGALIMDVTEDGPAESAGIRKGDVITAIDGHSLLEPLPHRDAERDLDLDWSVPVQRLRALMRDVEPGDEVEVTYERDGAETTVTVEASGLDRLGVGALGRGWRFDPEDFRFDLEELGDVRVHVAPRARWFDGMTGAWGFSGFGGDLELANLNAELGSYFGAEEGVLVLDIDEDSPLGLEPGDVLLDIDGREVRDREHARRILGSYEPGEDLSFTVIRRGQRQTVAGSMPEPQRRRWGGLRN